MSGTSNQRVDSNLKVAFQTTVASLYLVAGVNPSMALLPASHVYDTVKAKVKGLGKNN